MRFQEYLDLDLIEYIKEIEAEGRVPKTLHTYQATKTGMDGFTGLSIHGCPGKSAICQKYCYDAKSVKTFMGGKSTLRKAAFYTYWALYDPERLEDQLMREVPICTEVIRVHVGGDFVNPQHVKLWRNVAKKNPNTIFYCYTRSWRLEALNKELLKLKELKNFTVFASVDANTLLPKDNYRLAQFTHVFDVPKSIVCPEQQGKVQSCIKCKICFSKDPKLERINLIFQLHGPGQKINNTKIIRE